MSRRPTGVVRTYRRKNGLTTFSLRFSAYGQRRTQTLGTEADGWTLARAELELRNTLARVEAGIWAPPEAVAEVGEEPTFHEFASRWLTRRTHELRQTTVDDYRWRLSRHLLPFFRAYRPSQIDIDLIDRYREHKLIERDEITRARAAGVFLQDADGRSQRPLGNESINKTLALLAAILDDAVERGWLATNPARGRRRRLKAPRPHGTFLEPDELNSLLEAAGQLEEQARSDQKVARREILATLALAGLRVTELCQMTWKQLDFAHARIQIPDAKTPAGIREVDMTPLLHEILLDYRTRLAGVDPAEPVFPTRSGKPRDKDNIRNRVLARCVQRASQNRESAGLPPLGRVTPHTLRYTFISLLLANGAELPYVMAQVGHADESTTLRIYAKVLRRDRRHVGKAIDEMVGGAVSAASADMVAPNRTHIRLDS
ncbi:MAG: tyrosine-type recombinase/integrase [Solirubrobacteraceae bacterium]